MHFSLIPWYFDYLQSRNQNHRRHTNRVTVINDEPSTTKLQNILQVEKRFMFVSHEVLVSI